MLKNYTKVKRDKSGTKRYRNDEVLLHRLDGPAIEYKDGTKFWIINGKHHRNIDPAIEWTKENKQWFFKYDLHRIGNSPCSLVEWWYIHGKEYSKKQYFNKVWDI